jgi:hypothetical protein
MFRSTAGQPAVRKHWFSGGFFLRSGRLTVRSCNQTVEVGTLAQACLAGSMSQMLRSFAARSSNARPLLPQVRPALSARAGLVHFMAASLLVCSHLRDGNFSSSGAGAWSITIRPGEAESALQACTRQGIARPRAYRCTRSGGSKTSGVFLSPSVARVMPAKRAVIPRRDVAASRQTSSAFRA